MALCWLWWRAWARFSRRWRRGTLRGRRGTWWHPPSFRVAGVALDDIRLRFAWQAWNLWHWAGSGVTRHLCHTPSFTHPFVTHYLSHTIFDTPSFKTLSHTLSLPHNIFHTLSFTHPLSHPALSHAIFDTPSFTHHIDTHHLWHTIFHTQLYVTTSFTTPSFTHSFHTHHLSHTTLSLTHHLSLSLTIFHIQLCHTQLCFTSRSSTTSFVFPSFLVPATIFGSHYWKKLSSFGYPVL